MPPEAPTRPVKIAVAAMGGQGGGVLADWIVDMAEHAGWIAQATSVPGVAQRTGATVYYLEIMPREAAGDRTPVMALMPVPGDVDIALAGELAEAGRAVLRGFVTPDRTTLIASRHREYALAEKAAPGDGRIAEARLLGAIREAAARVVCFDMQRVADETGSVISAVLLGALAGSGTLPFARACYEEAIRRGGVAVDSSLAGFAAGHARAQVDFEAADRTGVPLAAMPASASEARIRNRFPESLHPLLEAAVRRLADYQDRAYAEQYLQRCEALLLTDADHGGKTCDYRLTATAARYLALWMSYEDGIRVADLKTRASRFTRVRTEVGAGPDAPCYVSEYLHPRVEELCDLMPAWLGRFVLDTPALRGLIGLGCRRGRRLRSATVSGYLMLRAVAALRRLRRHTHRYRVEHGRIERWLATVHRLAAHDYALACEVAALPRLIKGYGDTHARGLRAYETVLGALPVVQARGDAAEVMRELREAALADASGTALDEAFARHALARAA